MPTLVKPISEKKARNAVAEIWKELPDRFTLSNEDAYKLMKFLIKPPNGFTYEDFVAIVNSFLRDVKTMEYVKNPINIPVPDVVLLKRIPFRSILKKPAPVQAQQAITTSFTPAPQRFVVSDLPQAQKGILSEISTKQKKMPGVVEGITANRKRKRTNRIDPNLEGAGYKSKGQCEEEGRVPYKRGDKSYCRNAPKGEGTTKRIRAMAKAMKIKITYVENGKRRYVPTYHLLNEIESRKSSGL